MKMPWIIKRHPDAFIWIGIIQVLPFALLWWGIGRLVKSCRRLARRS